MKSRALLLTLALLGTSLGTVNSSVASGWEKHVLFDAAKELELALPGSSTQSFFDDSYRVNRKFKSSLSSLSMAIAYSWLDYDLSDFKIPISFVAGSNLGFSLNYGYTGKEINAPKRYYTPAYDTEVNISGLEAFWGVSTMAVFNLNKERYLYLKGTINLGYLFSFSDSNHLAHYKVGLGVVLGNNMKFEIGGVKHTINHGSYTKVGSLEINSIYLSVGTPF